MLSKNDRVKIVDKMGVAFGVVTCIETNVSDPWADVQLESGSFVLRLSKNLQKLD